MEPCGFPVEPDRFPVEALGIHWALLAPGPGPIHLLAPVGPILKDSLVGSCWARALGPFMCWAPGPVGAIQFLGPVGGHSSVGP